MFAKLNNEWWVFTHHSLNYLCGDAYSAAVVLVKENGGAWNIYYLGRDYQGSITHLINALGTVVQKLSYDPWGRLRNPCPRGYITITCLHKGTGWLVGTNGRLRKNISGCFCFD